MNAEVTGVSLASALSVGDDPVIFTELASPTSQQHVLPVKTIPWSGRHLRSELQGGGPGIPLSLISAPVFNYWLHNASSLDPTPDVLYPTPSNANLPSASPEPGATMSFVHSIVPLWYSVSISKPLLHLVAGCRPGTICEPKVSCHGMFLLIQPH